MIILRAQFQKFISSTQFLKNDKMRQVSSVLFSEEGEDCSGEHNRWENGEMFEWATKTDEHPLLHSQFQLLNSTYEV